MKLGTTDLVILLVYLAATVAFGLWMGGKQRDASDYMVGGRSLPWWVVMFSIVATETSTVTFLSIPGIAWGGDLTWLQIPLGFVVGRLLVTVLLLPGYFQGTLFSAYEVLERRFGDGVRRLASVLFMVTRTLADGMRLFLSAIVFQELAGVPMEAAIVVLGIATIGYTFVGGMRAVVWTDLVQFFVYVGGAAVAFGVLLDGIDGGWETVRSTAEANEKFRLFDTALRFDDATNLWAGLIGGTVLAVGTHGVDQMLVQRYLCSRGQMHATAALSLSGIVVWSQFAFFMVIGVALFAYYEQHGGLAPDVRGDRVFATFIVDQLPVGVLGIVLGAVFSAAMSTLSSSLNSSATALVADIWVPLAAPCADEVDSLRFARIATVGFGIMQIAVGIGAQYIDSAVVNSVLGIAGFTTGVLLGVFLLGTFDRRAGSTAAFAGVLVGLTVMTWVYYGTSIAWPWYALLGSSTTLLTGSIVARLVGRAPRAGTGLVLVAALACSDGLHAQPTGGSSEPPTNRPVQNGVDVLEREAFARLAGAKVGLITNHTGRTLDGRSTVSAFLAAGDTLEMRALFSPEHGFAGTLDQAEIANSTHGSGLPIHSLYGKTRKPTPAMLEGVDTLVFDIQDIGCRFYTYVSTLRLAMEAAAESGRVRVVVLDRPNPLGGDVVEGPVLDAGTESFVGYHTVPVRHGMTVGELARMMHAERDIDCELEVVEMVGWRRAAWFDATGQQWIDPSPNMRSLRQALLYPGVGLLEFTNLSVGRGTDTPFEVLGAPWLDGRRLAALVNARGLPGCRLVPIEFTPTASKFADESCGGVELIVTDRDAFRALDLGMALAWALRTQHAEDWQRERYARLLCDARVFEAVGDGAEPDELVATWRDELATFVGRRRRFLIYE